MQITLSKSQYMRGIQCPKSLWLFKHKPELQEQSGIASEQEGIRLGAKARELFPGGELIEFKDGHEKNAERTAKLIHEGVSPIYEATFIYDETLVMIDVLNKGDNGWEIYEVKGSSEIKTHHVDDLAVQVFIAKNAGLNVDRACLIHVNNQYEKNGALDLGELFIIDDLSETVLVERDIQPSMDKLKEIVVGEEPDIEIGPQCKNNNIDCDFLSYCWKHIPPVSVFSLTRLLTKRKFELYNQGIVTFDQLPSDYEFSDAQRFQVIAELEDKEIISRDDIEDFIAQLEYPLGFLDFETFNPTIPLFDKHRPFQAIPSQFSLHVEKTDGSLTHFEFLAESGVDPRIEFADRLIEDTRHCSHLLVYNKAFENRIIRELADYYPEKAGQLLQIVERVIDLMDVFKNKHYYNKKMNGSHSIKWVLPAMVPDLSYKNLAIGNGGAAMNAFTELQYENDPLLIEKTREALLEYCCLDTYAMVKILERLRGIAD